MRLYLDAGIFLAYLNGNEKHSEACKSIIDACRRGDHTALTSYLSTVEVVKKRVQGLRRLHDDEKAVTDLMDADFLTPIALELSVATFARYIVWDFRSSNKDAIHLASAVFAKCERLYTTDEALVTFSGRSSQRVELMDIRVPEFLTQPELV